MIRFILNRVPRGALQRLAGWMMPLAGLFYTVGRGKKGSGRGVECPLCGSRYRRFMPYGYVEVRKNALCPRCLSLERHRLLWLWLGQGEAGLEGKFLHIAPEVCLERKFEKIFTPENYITADLESPLAKVKMDVQAIPFPDETFDIVFCNHVLEHVADDRRAMSEMYRVMKPGGWGVMLAPIDQSRESTFEDDAVTDPAERTRLFGQYDHRRVYGKDYVQRLREAGWQVEETDFYARLPQALQSRYALRPETLHIVRRGDKKA